MGEENKMKKPEGKPLAEVMANKQMNSVKGVKNILSNVKTVFEMKQTVIGKDGEPLELVLPYGKLTVGEIEELNKGGMSDEEKGIKSILMMLSKADPSVTPEDVKALPNDVLVKFLKVMKDSQIKPQDFQN
jgi:hypothetical protein